MEERTRVRLRAVGLAALLAVGGFVLGVVVGNVLALVLVIGFGVALTGPVSLGVSLVSIQGIAFPLVALWYLRRSNRSVDFLNVRMPSGRDLAVAVGAWPALQVLVVVTLVVLVTFSGGTEPASNQAGETAMENPEIIPLLIPLVFLFNAPGEELLFRGVIQGSLRDHFGPGAAIVLATAMFAPLHIFALIGSLQAMLVTIAGLFVPGLVFGMVYEHTENLVVPSLTHGLYNATLFGLVYVAATTEGSSALLTAAVPL